MAQCVTYCQQKYYSSHFMYFNHDPTEKILSNLLLEWTSYIKLQTYFPEIISLQTTVIKCVFKSFIREWVVVHLENMKRFSVLEIKRIILNWVRIDKQSFTLYPLFFSLRCSTRRRERGHTVKHSFVTMKITIFKKILEDGLALNFSVTHSLKIFEDLLCFSISE